jgi:DNA-nicking Smr family endonuclease
MAIMAGADTHDDDDEGGVLDAPVDMPIDGTLDLHTFAAKEVKAVVVAYVEACRERGILSLRIVHGKGTGSLRRQVHAVLGSLPEVARFALADGDAGSWGATLVTLHAP